MGLIEDVTRQRALDTAKEIENVYPDVRVSYEVRDGRGIITASQDRFVVGKEFVESEESLRNPQLLREYARVLMAKCRLLVVVPQHTAAQFRLRMLEPNNWWLFYYQIHFYGEEDTIRRMDRRAWRRMMRLPPDEIPPSPEVV